MDFNEIIFSAIIAVAVVLIFLIIKENREYRKHIRKTFNTAYKTRLRSEFDIYEDEY